MRNSRGVGTATCGPGGIAAISCSGGEAYVLSL